MSFESFLRYFDDFAECYLPVDERERVRTGAEIDLCGNFRKPTEQSVHF